MQTVFDGQHAGFTCDAKFSLHRFGASDGHVDAANGHPPAKSARRTKF